MNNMNSMNNMNNKIYEKIKSYNFTIKKAKKEK